MGKQITLYCPETPGLKLGPGSEIIFTDGYAVFDSDDFPDWPVWRLHPGTPPITILDEDAATSGDGSFQCPKCDKPPFATQKGLNGHLLSHRPASTPVSKPAKKAAEPDPDSKS